MDSKQLPTVRSFHVTGTEKDERLGFPRVIDALGDRTPANCESRPQHESLYWEGRNLRLRRFMGSGENSGGIMMGVIRSLFRQLWAVQRTVGRHRKGCGSGQEPTKTIKPRIEFESWDEEWRYRKGAVRLQSSTRTWTSRVPSDRPV